MFARRYSSNELIDIIAAPSYDPELVAYCEKVQHFPKLSSFLTEKPKLGVTGTIAKDYVEPTTPKAVPYITTKQVKGYYAYVHEAKFISSKADEVWAKCRVNHGDIVINKSGNVGAAAIVKSLPFQYVNSVSDIICIKLNENIGLDKEFLVVFLNSPFGQKQLQRLSGGAIFDHVSLSAIPDINIYTPNVLCQKYIGDKVRQAERLRDWGIQTEKKIKEFYINLIPSQSSLNFTKKTRSVSVTEMSERLDAHFYPGVVEQYFKEISATFLPIKEVCTNIYNGQTQSETENAKYCDQVTVANLSSNFIVGNPRQVERPSKNDRFTQQHDILMCNAAHNKSYIGRDLTYVHSNQEILPSTEVMVIRVNRSLVPASYVRAYLLTQLGYIQIQSTIRGISAHSYPDDVALLNIPIPSKQDIWIEFDNKMLDAGLSCEYAGMLISSTKILVEALIEGQITEEELILAQQALETGNTEPDAAILRRLKSDGLDGKGQPLFSDLEQLYNLLHQAEQDRE